MSCLQFDLLLHSSHVEAVLDSISINYLSEENIDSESFIKEFIDEINAMNLFTLESANEKLALSEAFKELLKQSLILEPALITNILKQSDLLFNKLLDIGIQNAVIEVEPTEKIIANMPEDIKEEGTDSNPSKAKLDLNSFYPKPVLKDYMIKHFTLNMVNTTVVDFNNRRIIKTTDDLNESIANYKNRLFKTLFDFIKSKAVQSKIQFNDSLVDYIYDEEGEPNIKNMEEVLKMAEENFKQISHELLANAFISRFIKVNGELVNQLLIDAYNAYVLLQEGIFDNLLLEILGHNLHIKKIYKGETNIYNEKYKLSFKNTLRNSWGGAELTDAVNELGLVSRLLIESTPRYDYSSRTIIPDSYLDLNMFLSTVNKLNDPLYIRRYPDKIKQMIVKFKLHPNKYLKDLLETITNSTFNISYRIFSENDMEVFYSIYERFYNTSNPHSLISILTNDYKNISTTYRNFDLLDSIVGTVIRTNSTRYTLYAEDSDFEDITSREILLSSLAGKKAQREVDMRVSNKLRTDRNSIIQKYNLTISNNTTGDISFTITTNKLNYVFTYNKLNKKGERLTVAINGHTAALKNVIAEPSFNDLKDVFEHSAPVSKLQNEKYQVYIKLLEFVDTMLDTGFLRGRINLLLSFKNLFGANNLNYLTEELVDLASNAVLANLVYRNFEAPDSEFTTIEETAKAIPFFADMEKADWEKWYHPRSDSMKVVTTNIEPVEKLTIAEQTITGELYKPVTKNALGNNIPVNRTSNLANETIYYLYTRVLENDKSSLKSNLFAYNPNTLMGVTIKTDAISRNGIKKSASQFTEAEHGYSAIWFDFYSHLIQEGKESKYISTQPTIYSDKSTFYMWKNQPTYNIKNLNGTTIKVNLGTSSFKILNEAIKSTIGEQYKATYNKVYNDYRQIYDDNFISQILERLKEYGKQESDTKLSEWMIKNYNSILAKSKNYAKDNLEVINKQEIDRLNNEIQEIEKLNDPLKSSELPDLRLLIAQLLQEIFNNRLSNRLTDEEINALLSVTSITEFNNSAYNKGVHSIENLHYNKKTKVYKTSKGLLEIDFVNPNHLLIYNATKLYVDDAVYDKLMLREKKKFVRDLIGFNMSFYLTYSDGSTNKILARAIELFGGNNFRKDWINQDTKELIIAKINGVPITRTNPITDVRDDVQIEMNPLLERYFLADFLLSGNLKILTTGFELAHPNKSKAGDEITIDNAELEEASRQGALQKRNVIIPGTKAGYVLDSFMGVPSKMKLAVMPDIPALVFNINGVSDKIDAHDGSAGNNALWSILENLSLQDSAVGQDKKPIGHDFTDYGTATLLKFATFETYNERMRKSQLSPVSQYLMFKKMNSFEWEAFNNNLAVNLNKNVFGKSITLKDILNGLRLFFRSGNKHYEILGLDNTGNSNEYRRTIQEVDLTGLPIEGTVDKLLITNLNTNFKLYEALGGLYSESLIGNALTMTDASLYTTVVYINSVGEYTGTGYPTQENTRQPLKQAMIGYLVNKSAIKVGTEYINAKDAWTNPDTPLKFMIFNTDGLGMQMDADHIVADEEHLSMMTEFSQVISALEANGTSHEISRKAYKDLGKVALASIANIDSAMREFIESDFSPEGKSKIYEIVGTYIIKEFKKNGKDLGLSQSILAKALKEFNKYNKNHANSEFKIPFSDPSIFSKALAGFTSAINSTAIKRQFPGMGAVMVPAYNMMMNFRIDGRDMSYDDLYNLASKLGITAEEYLELKLLEVQSHKPRTIDHLMPNSIIRVADENGNLLTDDKGEPLEFNLLTYTLYRQVKDKYTHFYPVVSKPVNLKPCEIYWTGEDGKLYNVYDLPQVQKAFSRRELAYLTKTKIPKQEDLLLLKGINDALALLEKGYMTATDGTITIDGYSVKKIIPGTLTNNANEMILSKLYVLLFNLEPNDTLNDVLELKEEFFIKKYDKYHTPKTTNYDICYTRGNGKHTYIAFKDSPIIKNLAKAKLDNFVRDGDNLYKVDEDGNKVYRAGFYDENNTYHSLIESYYTTDGNTIEEVLVVENPQTAIDVYSTKEYDGVILNKSAEKSSDKIFETIELGTENKIDSFESYSNFIKELYKRQGSELKEKGEKISLKDLTLAYKKHYAEKRRELAIKKFASFLKSLEFIVARIPALTLQSFMKMKAVQFSDSEKNVVYVTHFLTWLLGSDYTL